MKVPIYGRDKTGKTALTGYILWDGHSLVCKPDIPSLRYWAQKPYAIVVDGEYQFLSPDKDPEGWLANLFMGCRGSYQWAGKAEE